MIKPLHIKFLEYLEPNGITKHMNIGPFMKDNFVVPYSDDYASGDEDDLGLQFILALGKKGYIYYDPDDMSTINKLDENNQRIWFDDFFFGAHIDIEGLDYLEKYRLNASVKLSNRATIWNFRATLILSLLTAFITAATLFLTKQNSNELSEIENRIDKLSLQLQLIQLQRIPQQSPISLHEGQSHKR
jgi:hypothetical protein